MSDARVSRLEDRLEALERRLLALESRLTSETDTAPDLTPESPAAAQVPAGPEGEHGHSSSEASKASSVSLLGRFLVDPGRRVPDPCRDGCWRDSRGRRRDVGPDLWLGTAVAGFSSCCAGWHAERELVRARWAHSSSCPSSPKARSTSGFSVQASPRSSCRSWDSQGWSWRSGTSCAPWPGRFWPARGRWACSWRQGRGSVRGSRSACSRSGSVASGWAICGTGTCSRSSDR